jgi:hypothetical protein
VPPGGGKPGYGGEAQMQRGAAAAAQLPTCWQSLINPLQREFRGLPMQMASPQAQVVGAVARASAHGASSGAGAARIGVSIAEQELGSA